jgi:biopolymer transport protein ExbB/TolQ
MTALITAALGLAAAIVAAVRTWMARQRERIIDEENDVLGGIADQSEADRVRADIANDIARVGGVPDDEWKRRD